MDELRLFLEQSVIDAELLDVPDGASSAADAASALGTQPENIIKSLVFVVDEEPVLVIVSGNEKVDESIIADLMEAEQCEIADPDTVRDATGYPIGGVPPVSLDLPKIVDESVLGKEMVYGGGGDPDTVIKLDPRFIVDEETIVEEVTI
ncbi:MAG: YbaK/EbsC family protein [Candidatus Nanohaloarchaeota archaeon QJJ-5]|nr:YbaK/EbsC family protein [Candidatus Nanohaloarchaeota archaeon QJJ-5]